MPSFCRKWPKTKASMHVNFRSMRRTAPVTFIAVILAAGRIRAATPAEAMVKSLGDTVLPALTERCFDCHDADSAKGEINLDILNGYSDARFDIRLWDKVREQVRGGTMPPKEKPQLSSAQKEQILAWIADNESAVLATPATDPGPHKLRRLTRHEYNYTLRDLLGVSARPGDDFPADGSGGEGFENSADTLFLPSLLVEKYLAGAEQAIGEVFRHPELRVRISDRIPADDQEAGLLLRPFLVRAYRRPVTEDEVESQVRIFSDAKKRGAVPEDAFKAVLKSVLVSPGFLLLREKNRPEAKASWQVDDFEMASRLSFFLWSSMPDATLFRLAAEHKLQDDAVLEAETKRMLADPKAEALARHFAGAWLKFEELFNSADPDRGRFREFNDTLRQAMFDEALEFSGHILRRNGRVLDFLDSDYSFVNEPLARLYEIPGVQGSQLRQVRFSNDRRGGLLGMAAILTTTSYPRRTSPVLRGKWVLEQILGTPPPPPPPNVPKLPEDDKKLKDLTVRQRFEKHRSDKVCAGCHARLDPPGFGLENFDAIGRWRDQENGKPLDATGVMPDGRAFNGAAEFRRILLDRKDQFLRTLCSRLLGYALGRGLELHDQPTVLRLEASLKTHDYHSEAMIIELVKSPTFRSRKNG